MSSFDICVKQLRMVAEEENEQRMHKLSFFTYWECHQTASAMTVYVKVAPKKPSFLTCRFFGSPCNCFSSAHNYKIATSFFWVF